MLDEIPLEPRFVVWRCDHCRNGIEFDAVQLAGRTFCRTSCPHCGQETSLREPSPPPRLIPDEGWTLPIEAEAPAAPKLEEWTPPPIPPALPSFPLPPSSEISEPPKLIPEILPEPPKIEPPPPPPPILVPEPVEPPVAFDPPVISVGETAAPIPEMVPSPKIEEPKTEPLPEPLPVLPQEAVKIPVEAVLESPIQKSTSVEEPSSLPPPPQPVEPIVPLEAAPLPELVLGPVEDKPLAEKPPELAVQKPVLAEEPASSPPPPQVAEPATQLKFEPLPGPASEPMVGEQRSELSPSLPQESVKPTVEKSPEPPPLPQPVEPIVPLEAAPLPELVLGPVEDKPLAEKPAVPAGQKPLLAEGPSSPSLLIQAVEPVKLPLEDVPLPEPPKPIAGETKQSSEPKPLVIEPPAVSPPVTSPPEDIAKPSASLSSLVSSSPAIEPILPPHVAESLRELPPIAPAEKPLKLLADSEDQGAKPSDAPPQPSASDLISRFPRRAPRPPAIEPILPPHVVSSPPPNAPKPIKVTLPPDPPPPTNMRGPVDVRWLTDLGVVYFRQHQYGEAFICFNRAAQQGFATAQFCLAVCYFNGHGTKQDEPAALPWLQQAAAQGDANAEFTLGLAYRLGRGVAANESLARAWLQKAAAHGHPEAIARVREMGVPAGAQSKIPPAPAPQPVPAASAPEKIPAKPGHDLQRLILRLFKKK